VRVSYRFDRFQRRRRWVALPIAAVYKYVDDQGSYLAALVAYCGLISLFPLLLLLSSLLGFALQPAEECARVGAEGRGG